MPLKYQREIDNFNLSIPCPENAIPPDDMDAYRFSFSPVNHEHNFLPNVVFDRIRGIGPNYSKLPDARKCSRCGGSYYKTLEGAKNSWGSLAEQIRDNLGYTHVAHGVLSKEDGFIIPPVTDHFTFYENDGVLLSEKFTLIEEL